MPRTTSISIGSELETFTRNLIKSERFGSFSEVVRSGLRLLEQQENQTKALKMAIDAGYKSGESSLTIDDIAEKVKQKHNV